VSGPVVDDDDDFEIHDVVVALVTL